MKKNVVLIDTGRDGYTPEQCYETLTVKELMDILEGFDTDMPVYFRNDNGYTYGFLSEERVAEGEFDFDDK